VACAYLGDEELISLIILAELENAVIDTGSPLVPPNRCWLVLEVVNLRLCHVHFVHRAVMLVNAMLNIGRVGSQSPWGPVLMLFGHQLRHGRREEKAP